MRFGPVPPSDAAGAILAHSLAAPGLRLKKGTVLGPEEVAALEQAGVAELTVARLDPDDVAEDAAAAAVADALVPDPAAAGLRLTAAATGRANLYATQAGLLVYEPGRIHALNAVDPTITLAVLPPLSAVREGTMVGTVKIIAYGVGADALARAREAGAGALKIAPPVLRRAVLIETEVPGKSLSDKGARAVAGRLEALDVDLDDVRHVPHEIRPLAEAIGEADADLVLVLTASATSDARDVMPEALRRSGGRVTRYGMPVDPGNLLVLGEREGRPVIGLPGCARSPALNGTDWVLSRVVCGIAVTDADIAAMGVGGLLKESPARGRPREG